MNSENIYISKLSSGQFFESLLYPGEWYQLVDDEQVGPEDWKFAVCIQTGKVRKFYGTQMVERIYLSIERN